MTRRGRGRPPRGRRWPPTRPRRPAHRAGLGLDLDAGRRQATRPARPRRLDRLRGGRQLVLLLADRDDRHREPDRWTASALAVEGEAWFDHQWGDFISIGGGGWDWFAVNLDDGTDLTLSLVRDADGSYPLVYGTLVGRDGTVRHLDRDAFTVDGHRPLAEPVDGCGLSGRLDDRASPASGLVDRADADGGGPGARHAGDDRGHLLGGLAGVRADRGGPRRSAARRTWS